MKGHKGPAGRSAAEQAIRRNAKRMINTGVIFYEKRKREINLVGTRLLKFAFALYILTWLDESLVSPFFSNFDDLENSIESAADRFMLSKATNIFDSPLLKVRSNVDADLSWLESVDDEKVAKLPNILGNSASHSDAKLVKLIYSDDRDILDEWCKWYNHDPRQLDTYTGMQKDGIWTGTELEGTIVLDNDYVEHKLNNAANTKIRELTKASECCYACARYRSCNSWSFCEHDDPEGNPNECGGKCHLSFIPNPTANKGADGKYSKPPAAIKVQGTQLEVPWVTGVLNKAVLPKTVSFTPGSSPLVRRIRLRGISINKGESDAGITIDIELTPSKSPMARATVQYISDIVTLGEMKDMDPESACLDCQIHSKKTYVALFGRIVGGWMNVGDPIPIKYDSSEVDSDDMIKKYEVAWTREINSDGEEVSGEFFINQSDMYSNGQVVWGKVIANADSINSIDRYLTNDRKGLTKLKKDEDGPRDTSTPEVFDNSLEFIIERLA